MAAIAKERQHKGDPQHSVVMVTDTAGIDDKSFNQSAWEGMQSGAKSTNFQKDLKGTRIFNQMKHLIIHQTLTKPFQVNLKRFWHWLFTKNAVVDAADANPETNFVLIDDTVNGKNNVASATFRDNESAYLAGVATNTTKTNKVGFIGGVEGPVIGRFKLVLKKV